MTEQEQVQNILELLTNSQEEANEKIKTKRKSKTGKYNVPKTTSTMRVYKKGKIFFSEDVVQELNIEFLNKENKDEANGFYLIKLQGKTILVCVSRKNVALDIAASCQYNEDGTPKTSVNDNTGYRYKDLVKEWFTFDEGENYIDFTFDKVLGKQFKTTLLNNDKIISFVINKTTSRGNEKTIRINKHDSLMFLPLVKLEDYEAQQEVVYEKKQEESYDEEYDRKYEEEYEYEEEVH